MRRLFRVIVVVFFLVVIGAAAVPFLVPVDTMKDAVLSRIKATTGREVAMGKMTLSIFPDVALTAADVHIGNPAWAGGGDMVSIPSLRVGVELMPLLEKQVRLKELTLESPVITLVKRGNEANWQFAAPAPTPAAASASARKKQASTSPGEAFYLGDITIRNASLTYRDAAAPAPVSVSNVNVKLAAPDPDQKATLSGTAVYNGKKTSIDLTLGHPSAFLAGKPVDVDMKASFDSLDLTWKGTAANPGNVPDLTGKIDIREIDVSALAPGDDKKDAAATEAAAPAARRGPGPWSDDPIRLDALKSATADLHVSIGKLILPRTTLDDIVADVKLTGGVLSIVTNEVPAYSGTVKGALKAGSTNAVSLAVVFSNVKAEPLLHDFADYDKITGTMTAHLSVAGAGVSERAIVSSLAGNGDFALKDGSWRGHNIASMARNIGSAFQGGDSDKSTDFSDLSGTFTVKNGVVANSDLKMESPLLRVGGAGTADLPAWQVHYVLKPALVASLEGQGSKSTGGIVVPIKIDGPLNAPGYTPDLAGALTDNLGTDPSKLKANAKNLKKQLLNGGSLNSDSLKGLLR